MNEYVNQIDNEVPDPSIIQLLDRAQRWFETRIVHELAEREGWSKIQPADLKLLANLDCGATYASEVARRMGVSRQSVNKLLKNLVREKLLQLEDHPTQRNAKVIVMTEAGKEWVREAVAVSHQLEAELMEQIGEKNAKALRRSLESAWSNWNE